MNDRTDARGDTEHRADRAARARVGLSGKLLVLTIAFVMLSEVLIYLPSIANFRLNWLSDRIAAAQTAALVLQAAPDGMVPAELERRLLANVGASAIAISTGETRRLIAAADAPDAVDRTYDLRESNMLGAIPAALDTLVATDRRLVRVIAAGPMGGETIEIVMDETPLKRAMLRFSRNILVLSLIISVITASLVYLALTRLFVRPMRRITDAMVHFRADPEDASRIIEPSRRSDEIGIAERELAGMQTDLRSMLQQRARLAALGLAVSKINHDLRNLLASASLAIDRMGSSADPTVQRFAPKLLETLDRAVRFCETTLRYGQADEAPPVRYRFALKPLVDDVGETLMAGAPHGLRWINSVDGDLVADADPEHIFRILMNLGRNAVQALESADPDPARPGEIRIAARREGAVVVMEISDNGPGLSPVAREKLFEAFGGSTTPGGTGLGLAIAAELVHAHGGRISLVEGTLGATFRIVVPDRVIELRGGRPKRRA